MSTYCTDLYRYFCMESTYKVCFEGHNSPVHLERLYYFRQTLYSLSGIPPQVNQSVCTDLRVCTYGSIYSRTDDVHAHSLFLVWHPSSSESIRLYRSQILYKRPDLFENGWRTCTLFIPCLADGWRIRLLSIDWYNSLYYCII